MREGSGCQDLGSQAATDDPPPINQNMPGRARELSVENWHPPSRTESSCVGGAVGIRVELGGLGQLEREGGTGAGTGNQDPCPTPFSVSKHLTQPQLDSHTEQAPFWLLKNILPDRPLKNR